MLGKLPKKGEVVDLMDLPENVVFLPGAFQVTNVDVPVRLPDGTVGGKARVIQGDGDEVSVLVEIESSNPIVASLFKQDKLFAVSLVTEEQMGQG